VDTFNCCFLAAWPPLDQKGGSMSVRSSGIGVVQVAVQSWPAPST